jgi:hypothetical protein
MVGDAGQHFPQVGSGSRSFSFAEPIR